MYETFGFVESSTGDQSITLFIPDNTVDPKQYGRGGQSHIAAVSIVSDFQHIVTPGTADWDPTAALVMRRTFRGVAQGTIRRV